MKTFKDLDFKLHPTGDGKQGLLFFPNGYGVSVVQFKCGGTWASYTSDESEWELAVLKGDAKGWRLTYETPVTEDVEGHLSEDSVTEIMHRVQNLPDTTPISEDKK